jgi:two-component sensor histidine kinase
MIFLFIKDKAYLYYIFYLISLILMNSYYSGFIPYYLLSAELASWSMKLHMIFISILFTFTILFTQEVLQTKKFIKLHKILNLILYLLPFTFILSYNSNVLNPYLLSLYISIGLFLIYTGLYTLFKDIYAAKYYVFAWSPLIIILIIFTLETAGLYTLNINLTYVSDLSFVLEALLFSIALAHRIKIANDQKALADAQLISYQEKEKKYLNTLVLKKTDDLEKALTVKELLYKELNHRIRNNFMIILSLLRLQISRTKIIHTKDSLKIMENRIKSISNLYQMMILNSENINVNTAKYLDRIAQDVKVSFKRRVRIEYDIEHNIEVDSLVYVGLIFNELISNSIKHAFTDNEGKIFVTLKKENDNIYLKIKDNGKGFTQKEKKSLGSIIVETLVEEQLEGKLSINSNDGTEIMISWKEEI